MSSRLFAILMALAAVTLGALIDAVVKLIATEGLSVLAILFWRFLIAAVFVSAAYVIARQPRIPWPAIRFHALRGLVHAITAGLFFYGVTQIPLAEATSLGFTAVLMMAPLERLFLDQPLHPRAIWAAFAGFAGVLIISLTGEGAGAEEGGHLLAGRAACLVAALFYALSLIMLRARAKADGTFAIAVVANVGPAFWLAIPALSLTPLPSADDFPELFGVAVLGTSIWVLMTIAYARAPAQTLAPLEYSSLLWSAIFGWALFNETPGPGLWIGAGVIIAACLLTMMEGRSRDAAG